MTTIFTKYVMKKLKKTGLMKLVLKTKINEINFLDS